MLAASLPKSWWSWAGVADDLGSDAGEAHNANQFGSWGGSYWHNRTWGNGTNNSFYVGPTADDANFITGKFVLPELSIPPSPPPPLPDEWMSRLSDLALAGAVSAAPHRAPIAPPSMPPPPLPNWWALEAAVSAAALVGVLCACALYCRSRRLKRITANLRLSRDRAQLDLGLLEHQLRVGYGGPSRSPPVSLPPAPPSSSGPSSAAAAGHLGAAAGSEAGSAAAGSDVALTHEGTPGHMPAAENSAAPAAPSSLHIRGGSVSSSYSWATSSRSDDMMVTELVVQQGLSEMGEEQLAEVLDLEMLDTLEQSKDTLELIDRLERRQLKLQDRQGLAGDRGQGGTDGQGADAGESQSPLVRAAQRSKRGLRQMGHEMGGIAVGAAGEDAAAPDRPARLRKVELSMFSPPKPGPCPGGCGFAVTELFWAPPGAPHCCRMCFAGLGHGPFCSRKPFAAAEGMDNSPLDGAVSDNAAAAARVADHRAQVASLSTSGEPTAHEAETMLSARLESACGADNAPVLGLALDLKAVHRQMQDHASGVPWSPPPIPENGHPPSSSCSSSADATLESTSARPVRAAPPAAVAVACPATATTTATAPSLSIADTAARAPFPPPPVVSAELSAAAARTEALAKEVDRSRSIELLRQAKAVQTAVSTAIDLDPHISAVSVAAAGAARRLQQARALRTTANQILDAAASSSISAAGSTSADSTSTDEAASRSTSSDCPAVNIGGAGAP